MAQQGSSSGSGGGIDSFFSTNFLSNFKYNTSSTPQQEQQYQNEQEQQSTLSGKQQQFSSNNNNYLSSASMNNWFSSKPASSSSLFLSHPSSSSSVNNTHHHFTSTFPITPISRSLSDNTLSPLKSSSYNNNNNNPAVIDASFSAESSKKKRKRCDEEYENEELEYEHNHDNNINNNNNNIDLMREAMILPTNVDNIMMEDSSNNNNIGEYHDSSMFFPQSLFGNVNSGLMQFSLQHQQPHNAFPLFESEEDMVTSASSTVGSGSVKKNRMSPQSHLIEFIRDNIMQYLLFHLKLDMRQTHNDIDTCTDDVNMSDSTGNMVEQDVVDITIPVGLLLDYIVQQAQRLYFNMYEYIRELASSSIKYHCKSITDNQKEIELSLACNEFEKVVIEQVHFLLSQIQLMRSMTQQSTSSNDSQIIPMLKKYDKILPKNFHTLRLVSSTNDDSSIGSNADSFTLDRGIVDESFLFKSSSASSSPPHIHRTSFAQNFDDMKTNSSSLNDISSLLLNTKFKLFY